MEPERWRRVEELYHSVLKIPRDQRAAFLENECQQDDALRREVESLLSYENSAKEFIESPAFDLAARLMAEDKVETDGRDCWRPASHCNVFAYWKS